MCAHQNKDSAAVCMLCGTAQDEIRKTMDTESFGSIRGPYLAYAASKELNTRQKRAANRQSWMRSLGSDGKRHWTKRPVEAPTPAADDSGSKDLDSFHSAVDIKTDSYDDDDAPELSPGPAFVSRVVSSPQHPDGLLRALNYAEANPLAGSDGHDIDEDDITYIDEQLVQPFAVKYEWFVRQTTPRIMHWTDGPLKIRVRRKTVVKESIWQLGNVASEHLSRTLRIEFVGEVAIDAGGLEREWFELMGAGIFDDTFGLFTCIQGDSCSYSINPNSADILGSNHLLFFRGAGRLLGRALLEGRVMRAPLALPILKHLLATPISLADLEFVDEEVYQSLLWLKENIGVDSLSLDFSITRLNAKNDIEVIDLKENGRDIEVTDANKDEYINLRMRYIMLDSFAEQLQYLMTGVFEVIPQELLLVFDYQELEFILCGAPSINVDDWKAHTQISDGLPKELLDWFWDIVESFSAEECARLLQFATGSSRVPVQGFRALTSYDGRVCPFSLNAVKYSVSAYPRAHTCFNRLDLPIYTTKQELSTVLRGIIGMDVTGFTDE